MKLKKKEFADLTQGSMSVCAYRDKFTELSRYSPTDVATDQEKQDKFLEGLDDGLSYVMSNVKYANFQEMVDRAIVLESKRKKMEDKKRKSFYSQQQGSNNRPRFNNQQSYQYGQNQ